MWTKASKLILQNVVYAMMALLDFKSAKLGALITAGSLLLFIGWLASQQSLCDRTADFVLFLEQNTEAAFALLMAWCMVLFLTVLPLGTATILIAGYLLGPIAGFVQYAALIAASIVLYELGRESDRRVLEERFSRFPKFARFADLARERGFIFVVATRLIPVVPSAVASLGASYFFVSRRDFLAGTIIAGWCRPMGFALLGSLGRFAPICGLDPVLVDVLP